MKHIIYRRNISSSTYRNLYASQLKPLEGEPVVVGYFKSDVTCYFEQVLTKFLGTEVLKCKEGMNNRAYLLTMDNGSVVLAKLPNSGAGPGFYTTASEVATRAFVGVFCILSPGLDPSLAKTTIAT